MRAALGRCALAFPSWREGPPYLSIRQGDLSSTRFLHLALFSLILTLGPWARLNATIPISSRQEPLPSAMSLHYLRPPALPTTKVSSSEALADPDGVPEQSPASLLMEQGEASSGLHKEGLASGPAVVQRALAYLGAPYRWSGATPSGFDCSGFVQYLFSGEGLWVPRDLEAQLGLGTSVTQSTLRPGDLVYFENTFEAGLSHVGIYVGSGRFISAVSEASGVALRSLDDPFWSQRYVTARRVLP